MPRRLPALLQESAIANPEPDRWTSPATLAAPSRLAHELRVHVLLPLLAQLRAACEKPWLVELCGELKMQMLMRLDARTLAMVGAVCRELRDAARDDELWRELCRRDFSAAAASQASPPGGWRRVYTIKVAEQRAREAARRQAELEEQAMRHDYYPYGPARPDPGMGGYGVPLPQPGFPGMIGGDYDRMPGGLPGGLPLGPGGLPLGPLGPGRLGPFGDPDGRLPAGAVPPGARYDPIHPDMDIDGGFGGGGGLPMPGGPGRRGGSGMRGRGRGLHPDMPDPTRFY
jgi:hypothetical protein